MRAIGITEYGHRDKLMFLDVPQPQIAETEVLVRIRAAGINPVDWKIREGLLARRMPSEFPIVLGWDCAGEVVQCGARVQRVAVGDRVFGYARKERIHDGTYAEYVALAQGSVARIPASVTFEQAAAVPLAGLTSWQALFEVGNLKAGQWVLIHAGAGGTGGFAVQLARHAGARIISTARASNHEFVRSLGADHVIDYAASDFRVAVRGIAPQGVDLAYDTVGGETQIRSADVLKPGALLVSILAYADEAALQAKGIQTRYLFVRPDADQLDELSRLLGTGALKVHLAEVLPWTDIRKAHELIESGRTKGKIVLQIS